MKINRSFIWNLIQRVLGREEPAPTSEMERIVLEAIARFPNGATLDDVMSVLTQYERDQITPRFAPLSRKGYIKDAGKRKGSKGRKQRVMVAVRTPTDNSQRNRSRDREHRSKQEKQ